MLLQAKSQASSRPLPQKKPRKPQPRRSTAKAASDQVRKCSKIVLVMFACTVGLSLTQGQTWNVQSIYQRSLQVNPAATSALQAVVQAQQHVAEINAQRRMQVT